MVPRSMAATLTLLSLTLGWFGERLNAERRVMLACSAFAVIAALLIAGSASAKKHVKASLQANFPRAQTHELVLTPMPANPVCWSVLAVQTESLRYVVRSATSSVLPFWFSSSECVFGTERRGTAHSQLIAVAAEPKLRYLREFSVPLNQISELLNAHCRAAAFMRFSRVPFLTEYPSIGRVMLDLRYDRTEALEFAEFSLADRNCPKWIPPWLPPRSELLNQPTP
jgi:inner membrane protein